jgi:hypothetical protein
MPKWCIRKKNTSGKVATWPGEPRDTFRKMDKAGKLYGYHSAEDAQAAIPEVLLPFCCVSEYMEL